MTRIVLLMLIVFYSGCATQKSGDGGILSGYKLSRDLDRATLMLQSGDREGAAKALAAICDSGGVAGVTDEALFRLALVSLRPATAKDGNQQSLQLLKRLKKEYPASRWTEQSGPLVEMLAGIEELRRQNRNYKNLNQSLNSEIKELNHNIDKLKRLDLELEKKHR
jgi:cell division protein FtsB